MNFDELERELRIRKQGQRRERAALVCAIGVGLIAVLVATLFVIA